MANLKITEHDGRVIEVSDLTFDEVYKLVSRNGNGVYRATVSAPRTNAAKNQADYASFKNAMSDSARKFLQILSQHPAGLSADHVCEQMGFNSTNQIGGVTGGGLKKISDKFHVPINSIYTVEKSFKGGERKVTYKPGNEVQRVL